MLYWESLNGQLPLLTWSLSPIYTFVADTFEMVADRNYVMVDTFNCRLYINNVLDFSVELVTSAIVLGK